MRIIDIDEQAEEIEFVKKAAKVFKQNPGIQSYTDGDIKAGCLFALKWGMHDRAILLLRLDEDVEPVIYGDVIETD